MIIDKECPEITVSRLMEIIGDPDRNNEYVLVDLRDESAYALGTIPGSVSVPLNHLGRLAELPSDKTWILFCRIGTNSCELIPLAEDLGVRAFSLAGGYVEYLRICIDKHE